MEKPLHKFVPFIPHPLSLRLLPFAFCFLSLMGCAPTVQITTPKPLKVDVTMKVDVYQRDVVGTTQRKLSDEETQALRRRDNRSGEIWAMKNDGVAIEGEHGYLEAKTLSGWDPNYVNRLVTEENHDRHILYEREAIESARPLSEIEAEAGRRLREQTYGGSGSNTNRVTSSSVPTKP